MDFVKLWSELRRRRVVRVAVAYMAVAWLLIEVSSVVVPELMLPDWITRAVIVVLMLGFPVALILAWALDITPKGIRVTGSAAETASAAPHADHAARWSSRRVFIAFIAGVLLTAGALYFYQSGRTDADLQERARLQLAEIRQLAGAKQYVEAYALAIQVESTLNEEAPLDEIWADIADHITVISEPAGATVTARMIPKENATNLGEEIDLGVTPLENFRIARSDWLIRLEHDGFATVERIASSGLNRVEPGLDSLIKLQVLMLPADEVPRNMVWVPGGAYQLVSPDMPTGLKAVLDDFFIDKYEVSNADFREFIRGGGYRDQSLWPATVTIDGETITHQELLKILLDRAGLNGPRDWTGQVPPKNSERHPVTGVTWHEASAFCASVGKRLPSVFQWEKAARNGRLTHAAGVVMPWGYSDPSEAQRGRANFAGDGTLPVDAIPAGMSPFGAYAMAGNVKEWTANSSGNRYIVTGGSWEDPDYLFSEFGLHEQMLTTPSLGFRCARVQANDARRFRDQGSFALNLDERTPVYEPVDEETFKAYREFYRYDTLPLRAQVLETVETPDWIRETVSYVGPQNERVPAYLWLPKSAAPPFQTILFIPGASAFFSTSVRDAAERYMGPHIRTGRAVLAPLLKGMVGREWGSDYETPAFDSIRFRDLMVRHATELRRGLDYLETRSDIDAERIAYAGISLGAGSRLAWAAVDDRYAAIVFIGGGIDERMKPTLPEANNVNFAPYIKPPKLMVNGRHDEEHPWLTRGLPLWNLLSEPKQRVLLDGAGHVPAAELRVPPINKFLNEVLGAPR